MINEAWLTFARDKDTQIDVFQKRLMHDK